MKLKDKNLHLTYSTNVHPSENLTQIHQFLRETTIPLKQIISPDNPFGLGLYLSNSVVQELTQNEYRRWELDTLFLQNDLYAFTLNCFPFGDFHAQHVKEKVFQSDWSTQERLHYTNAAADLLLRWLPENVTGSISTHSGAYGKYAADNIIWQQIAENYTRAALHLHRLEQTSGKQIILALEPEPFAIIENTDEFINFYQKHLLPHGCNFLKSRWNMNQTQAEEILRRHIGLCFDTCHLSVQFENLAQSLEKIIAAQISIGKAQISVALKLINPASNSQGLQRLHSYIEPRYLHQTIALMDTQEKLAFADLPNALADPRIQQARELRSHFHVPIFWEGDAQVSTTKSDLQDLLAKLAQHTTHFEIETYTWDVIPARERQQLAPNLLTSLQNEYQTVLRNLH